MTTANDRQVAGSHYKNPLQHWDFAARARLGYFEGQITKYLDRHKKKNGLQDVEKGLHFAEKLRELAAAGQTPQADGTYALLAELNEARDYHPEEWRVMMLASMWRKLEDLEDLISAIKAVKMSFYGG